MKAKIGNKQAFQIQKITKKPRQTTTTRENEFFAKIITFVAFLSNIARSCLLHYHPPFPSPYDTLSSLSAVPLNPALPLQLDITRPGFPTTSPCPFDTYLNITTCLCLPCHSSCQGCFGPTVAECKHCKAGFKWNSGSYVGIERCWEDGCGSALGGFGGKYLDRHTGTCKSCSPITGLSECSGSLEYDALSCQVGYTLNNGRCLAPCTGTGKWFDPLYYVCRNCDASCGVGGSCNGPTSSDCTACGTQSGQTGYLDNGRCHFGFGTSCTSSQFYDSFKTSCEPCDASCSTCIYNKFYCLSCPAGKALLQENKKCYDICPEGTKKIGNICQKKPVVDCAFYDGSDICQECKDNKVLSLDKTKCLEYSEGKFWVDNNGVQFQCDLDCPVSCVNGFKNGCLGCGGYLDASSTCLPKCPGTHYHSHVDKKCKPCHASCESCFADNRFSCLSCPAGQQLYNDGSCGTACLSTQFADSAYNGCRNCDAACSTCKTEGPDGCIQCSGGGVLTPYGYCTPSCPSNFFVYSIEVGCSRCHHACQECLAANGHLNGHCLSCKVGFLEHIISSTLDPAGSGKWIDPTKKYCHPETSCGNGFFRFNSTTCVDHSLENCQFAKSKTECYKCKPGYVVRHDGTCSKWCDNRSFPLRNHTTCHTDRLLGCGANCLECTAGHPRSCYKCEDTYYLQSDNTCASTIPQGYWAPNPTPPLRIAPCHASCGSCVDMSTSGCLSCMHRPLYALLRGAGQLFGECRSPCPEGTSDLGAGVCEQCHSTCRRCTAKLDSTACSGCFSPKVLTPALKCEDSCPDRYYVAAGSVCKLCHSSCKKCFGSASTNCMACFGTNKLITDKGTCAVACPLVAYYESSGSCFPCHSTCETCSSTSPDGCLSCYPGDLLNTDGTCKPTCAQGSFQNSDKTCATCAQNCQTCTTSREEDCISCFTGLKMLPKRACTFNCTVYFYEFDQLTCRDCHNTCFGCSGPGANQCTSCDPGVLYNRYTRTCSCPEGTYYKDHRCMDCHQSCKTCSGPSEIQCIACKDTNILLLDGSCKATCPEKQFVLNGKCQKCHESCQSCRGPGEYDCTGCLTLYHILGKSGNCVDCRVPDNFLLECSYVKEISLYENKKDKDLFSSNTLEVVLEDQLRFNNFLKGLSSTELQKYLRVRPFSFFISFSFMNFFCLKINENLELCYFCFKY